MQRVEVSTIEDQINILATTVAKSNLTTPQLAVFNFTVNVAIAKLLICIHRDMIKDT